MGSGHQDLQAWFIRGLLRRLLRRHARGLLRGLIRELLRGHNFRGGVELVVDDDLHQVVHGVLDLDVLALDGAALLADVRLPHGHEVHDREALVRGEVHQQGARPNPEVLLHAALDDVVDIRHELLEALQPLLHVRLVGVDVHERPGQGGHAGAELELHIVEVRPRIPTRPSSARCSPRVVVALELLFLEQDDLRRLGDLDAHAVRVLGLANQLKQLHVEVDVQLSVWFARGAHWTWCPRWWCLSPSSASWW